MNTTSLLVIFCIVLIVTVQCDYHLICCTMLLLVSSVILFNVCYDPDNMGKLVRLIKDGGGVGVLNAWYSDEEGLINKGLKETTSKIIPTISPVSPWYTHTSKEAYLKNKEIYEHMYNIIQNTDNKNQNKVHVWNCIDSLINKNELNLHILNECTAGIPLLTPNELNIIRNYVYAKRNYELNDLKEKDILTKTYHILKTAYDKYIKSTADANPHIVDFTVIGENCVVTLKDNNLFDKEFRVPYVIPLYVTATQEGVNFFTHLINIYDGSVHFIDNNKLTVINPKYLNYITLGKIQAVKENKAQKINAVKERRYNIVKYIFDPGYLLHLSKENNNMDYLKKWFEELPIKEPRNKLKYPYLYAIINHYKSQELENAIKIYDNNTNPLEDFISKMCYRLIFSNISNLFYLCKPEGVYICSSQSYIDIYVNDNDFSQNTITITDEVYKKISQCTYNKVDKIIISINLHSLEWDKNNSSHDNVLYIIPYNNTMFVHDPNGYGEYVNEVHQLVSNSILSTKLNFKLLDYRQRYGLQTCVKRQGDGLCAFFSFIDALLLMYIPFPTKEIIHAGVMLRYLKTKRVENHTQCQNDLYGCYTHTAILGCVEILLDAYAKKAIHLDMTYVMEESIFHINNHHKYTNMFKN